MSSRCSGCGKLLLLEIDLSGSPQQYLLEIGVFFNGFVPWSSCNLATVLEIKALLADIPVYILSVQ